MFVVDYRICQNLPAYTIPQPTALLADRNRGRDVRSMNLQLMRLKNGQQVPEWGGDGIDVALRQPVNEGPVAHYLARERVYRPKSLKILQKSRSAKNLRS